jgi:hypothetical protein
LAVGSVADFHFGQKRVEAQREAPGRRDHYDSFIDVADGQPVDLKPQAREVPVAATRPFTSRPKGIRAARPALIFAARLAATKQRLARLPPARCLPARLWWGEPVDVGRHSNRVADAVEPHLGLLAQTVNLALEPSASSRCSIMLIPRPFC